MGAFKKFKMDPNERPVYYVDRIHRKTSFSQKTLLGYLPYLDEGYLKVFLADYT
ncbi:hypothetical protein [Flagellimonas sp. S3867]|uniref:hypothetical protein n=1 Tax=Flagellimonas sp. S3867 TaxID=2768063 RepID=UPI0016886BA5|nr:hypothetical protein [Flagellimonas sp. S3867]